MEKAKSPPLTECQRYWLEYLPACEASGKSIAEYAAEQGLVARAVYGGKKALVRKVSATGAAESISASTSG